MRLFEKITAENLTASAPLYIRKRERQKKQTFVCVNVSRGTYKEEERKK